VKITAERVVTIHSRIKHHGAAELQYSAGGDPLIQGHDNLVVGSEGKTEGALLGMSGTADAATTEKLEHGHIHGPGDYHP
jgi:hypothetical protein